MTRNSPQVNIETVPKFLSESDFRFSESGKNSTNSSVGDVDDPNIIFSDITFEEFVPFDSHLGVADDSENLQPQKCNSNDDVFDDEEVKLKILQCNPSTTLLMP